MVHFRTEKVGFTVVVSQYTWHMEPEDDSITDWIAQLRQGDEEASRRLWDHFFQRLLEVATRRLKHARSADYDEEDIVLSALKSFCLGVRQGRFPQLMIAKISGVYCSSSRAAKSQIALPFSDALNAIRRVRSFTVQRIRAVVLGSTWFVSGEPNPAMAAECQEQFSILLDRLQHEDLKRVAIWKMEGYTNEEHRDDDVAQPGNHRTQAAHDSRNMEPGVT